MNNIDVRNTLAKRHWSSFRVGNKVIFGGNPWHDAWSVDFTFNLDEDMADIQEFIATLHELCDERENRGLSADRDMFIDGILDMIEVHIDEDE